MIPYLGHPRPRVRAEAVRTLRRLGADADLTALLEDPAPVVVRNVVSSLRASGPGVPTDLLWTLIGPGNPRHVRRGAHRLLAEHETWSRIKADLILVTDSDDVLSRQARADLDVWRARDFTSVYRGPSATLLRDLETLIAKAETAIGADFARMLRWIIRS
ncbi:HEAT repeat domain-containing protein [Planotetraspora silvatica]|uniref:HEAT repeat domain-containing protein n=1 Tax=Planotetraspora silvatica TaxID=234614 RepID=UPI0031E08E91